MKKIILFSLYLLMITASAGANEPQSVFIRKISGNLYLHISVNDVEGFGKVSSNGVIYAVNGNAFLFDTPMTPRQTEILCGMIIDSMHLKIVGFIPNHWHNDCTGGLAYLKTLGIPSCAGIRTAEIMKEKGLPVPDSAFTDSLVLVHEGKKICCYFMGGGHSTDNIAVWFPEEKILFAGCMVKEMAARGKGNTADADLKAWPETLRKLLEKFPDARLVIPGHGEPGGTELIRHTIELVKQ